MISWGYYCGLQESVIDKTMLKNTLELNIRERNYFTK
jgi:hypothetical protein